MICEEFERDGALAVLAHYLNPLFGFGAGEDFNSASHDPVMLDLSNINVHTIGVKADLCAVFGYLSQPVNDIAKRLFLETNTVTPLLQRMEKEGIISRSRGREDARQIIVSLTPKGEQLQTDLSDVPFEVGKSVMCDSINPQTVPDLYRMLDEMIDKLK